ncbi:hypothetical protein SLEP1_g42967 [Rubroshorea leprosula]|uniref:Reverse transcriptase zinc-binding domain-containing protein n=1 Tax=Rubroshorea leprosula TaxID=152421 RepID=A0AAV5LBX9_9ROSI|nr:hypothetical protein SLEP1_g42967 [Rubroshorea leprosula]
MKLCIVKVQLTHLCFADDLIIFTDGSLSSVAAIDCVLKEFYVVSGLKVNYSKSEIFTCGLSLLAVQNLTATYGFKAGSLPVRYLGVPLITGRLTDKDLKPLISKITDRMNSWASKHLSFAGRLQLITSIIQGISNFWCSTFILPKRVIKEVEKLCSSFLWNGSANNAKGAKVNWPSVCYPKQEGGLGIKSLVQWNKACILRFIWMLFTKAGSIWVAWVHAYFLKGKSFWSVKIPNDASWGWRKLLKLRPQAKKLMLHSLGDGEDTFLWLDHWHPSGPLIDVYGDSVMKSSGLPYNAKVSTVVQGNYWNWPLARSQQLVQIQMALFDKLYPKEGVKDSIIWLPSRSGTFNTGSTWHWLRERQDKVPWHRLVWFSQSIPKHSFISWLAIHDRLTTRARQKKWAANINDTCLFCNSEAETSAHLFFKCSYTKQVWHKLCEMVGIPFTDTWQELLAWMGKKVRRKSLYTILIKLSWTTAVSHIWRERNRRVHQQSFHSMEKIVQDIQFDVRNKILGFAKPKTSPLSMDIAKRCGIEAVVKS